MSNKTRYTVFIGNYRTEQTVKTFPQEQYERAKAYASRIAEGYSACLYDETQTACDHWWSEDSGVYVEVRSEAC
jgi:hypothetical protein